MSPSPNTTCAHCGTPLYRRPWIQRVHPYAFCNHRCRVAGWSLARQTIPLAERFWSHVDRTGDCWLWLGTRNSDGYGRFDLRPDEGIPGGHGAHRVALYLATGVWPTQHVLHRCDNPPCVRPAHLFLGNDADNVHDCVRKGRRANLHGEHHGNARLTEEAVRDIRQQVADGTMTQKGLAAKWDVSTSTVQHLIKGHNWRHVV